MNPPDQRWRHDQAAHQIHPRSFAGSNGIGIVDLPGILARLYHRQTLGVGVVAALWAPRLLLGN